MMWWNKSNQRGLPETWWNRLPAWKWHRQIQKRENQTAWSLASKQQLGAQWDTEQSGSNDFHLWFSSSTAHGLPGKGPGPSLAGCRAEERPVAPAPGKLDCGSPRSTEQDQGCQAPSLTWSDLHFQVPLEPNALLLPSVCPQQIWIHLHSFLSFLI